MDAETRAALRRAIRALRLSRDLALYQCGCKKRAKKDRLAADLLQALLSDEKGGKAGTGVSTDSFRPAVADASPLRGAPPDSLARIAADLRLPWETNSKPGYGIALEVMQMRHEFAARIEALTLEPSEREVVAKVLADFKSLYWTTHYFGYAVEMATVERGQANRWIAALTPISGAQAMTDAKPDALEVLKERTALHPKDCPCDLCEAYAAWAKEKADARVIANNGLRISIEHQALRAAVERVRDELKEVSESDDGTVSVLTTSRLADALDAALRGQP